MNTLQIPPRRDSQVRDAATFFSNLSELTTDEKREIWMKRNGCTVKRLAAEAGVTATVLSRTLRNPPMPVAQHQALVAFGVPPECLPKPQNKKPGPRPSSFDGLPVSVSA